MPPGSRPRSSSTSPAWSPPRTRTWARATPFDPLARAAILDYVESNMSRCATPSSRSVRWSATACSRSAASCSISIRQPFYHLFAENAETEYIAYVSEQNLLPDTSGEPVRHPQVAEVFEQDEKGSYRPRNSLLH